MAAAKKKVREAHLLLGTDPEPVIGKIEKKPTQFRDHASPVNRELALAVTRRRVEQEEERRLQLEAAEKAEREARAESTSRR